MLFVVVLGMVAGRWLQLPTVDYNKQPSHRQWGEGCGCSEFR
jgi:hypothetical protein